MDPTLDRAVRKAGVKDGREIVGEQEDYICIYVFILTCLDLVHNHILGEIQRLPPRDKVVHVRYQRQRDHMCRYSVDFRPFRTDKHLEVDDGYILYPPHISRSPVKADRPCRTRQLSKTAIHQRTTALSRRLSRTTHSAVFPAAAAPNTRSPAAAVPPPTFSPQHTTS